MAREKYTPQSTHIDGYNLRRVGDQPIEMQRGQIRKHISLHRSYARADRIEKRSKADKKDLKPQLVFAAEKFGARGSEDRTTNSSIVVSAVENTKWDLDALKTALGDAYPAYVHDEVQVTIRLVSGVDEIAVRGALKTVLATADVDPADIDKLISVGTVPRVDDDAVKALIARGALELPDEAIKGGTSWAITVSTLDSSMSVPGATRKKVPQYFPSN